jgi:poly-beta-1,6-N-acetyl-D-glucosamine N-deacetylase
MSAAAVPDWKNLVSGLIRISLVPLILREVIHRRAVTILLYHDPSPGVMARHLAVLQRSYNLISLRQFVDAHAAGSFDPLPAKSLVITFDDGHQGNQRLEALLRALPAPPSIFLCSGVVGTDSPFWFRTVEESEPLKRIRDEERLALLRESRRGSNARGAEPQALSDEQITGLKPIVDFQSHTISHPILPYCDGAKAWKEINESKRQLESSYGLSIYALSYPNGDYSAREMRLAKEAGYTCALSVDFGFNSTRTDPYRLRRIAIDDDRDGTSTLVVKACGLWGFLKHLVARPSYGYSESPAVDP